MSPPTILFLCSELQTGGAERQWATLLPGLARRGFDVRLLTLSDRGRFFDEIDAAGIPCQCAELKTRFDLRGIARAFRLAKPPADLVVSHETNARVIGHLVARRAKVPHVTVSHRAAGRPLSPHRRVLERLVAPRVDCVIAVSESQLPELAKMGFDSRRARVIRNGIEPLHPTRARGEVRDSLGLASDAFVALAVAALRPVKRVHVFVEAVAAASKTDPRIVGLVAGGGEALSDLRRLADEGGAPVQLLGERADVADLIAASDVVCLTSSVETSPLALIEAMSLERPVVAPARGGTAEIVIDGETGILVRGPGPADFARALLTLAEDPTRTATLGRAGRGRYERLFTAERMLDEYADALGGLIRRSSSAASGSTVRAGE